MGNEIELTVKVNSETGQLEILNQKLGKTVDAANKTGSSFINLSRETGNLVKSFLPFASAGAVVAFFASAVKGAEEQNESFRRLKFTLESTGQSWEKNKTSISDWADAVASATRFSDGEALSSLDELARATKNLTQAEGASTLAQDLSVVSGKSLSETTRLVSDLITGQERAVTLANKEFMNYAGGAKTAQEALDNLSRSTKDAAINEHSFTKSMANASNAFSQFKDQLGNTVIPAVQTVTGGLVYLLKIIDNLGQAIAGEMAVAFHAFTGAADAITEMLKGNFTSAKNISKQTIENIKNDFIESGNKIVQEWENNEKKKTEILKNAHQERLAVNAPQNDNQTPLGPSREDFEKHQNEVAASNERLLAMEDELNVRMAQLNENSLQGKLDVLKAEEQAELNKVAKEKGYEENKEKVVSKTRELYRKKEEAALKVDAKMKAQMAMQAADVAIQALQTIDSMGEISSKNDARRAKLFLALRQSMAIANAWVSAMSEQTPGPIWAKVAMAAATTGLIVAQFAAQSKGIDKARAANQQEASSTSISTDYGNGTTITDTYGTGGSSSGTTTSGGVSSLGSSGGSSSGGGGGGSTIINVGGVTVQFSADSVDLSNVDMVARRLGEEVLRRTTEGVHLAVAIRNVGEANKNLAV